MKLATFILRYLKGYWPWTIAAVVATAVYALHCPEMAAPFLATWYLAGMLIPTVAGALLGPRLLRW